MNELSRYSIIKSLGILIFCLPLSFVLTSCSAANTEDQSSSVMTPNLSPTENTCHVTEPVWAKPPIDSAVEDVPDYGYYYINADRSIWTSAWWTVEEENYPHATPQGIKMGWLRPAGVKLEITGQRLDSQAPPLDVHIPCCYPTRFQATGLIFPTEGCWEITAKAADKVLSFIIKVEP